MDGKVLGVPLALIILVILIVLPLGYLGLLNYQVASANLKTLNNIQTVIIEASTPVEVTPAPVVSVVEETPTPTPVKKVIKQTEGTVSSTTNTAQ